MSGFSAEWLALREPYDLAARNATVLDAVAAAFHRAAHRSRSSISPAAPARRCARSGRICRRSRPGGWSTTISACWRVPQALGKPPHLTVVTKPVDLVRDLELALTGPLDLITASALLDLVSAEWLDRLIIEAAARRLPVYAALTYDGRVISRAGSPSRRRAPRRLQPASTHRQGLRPGARSDRGGTRDRAFRAFRLRGRARPLRLGVRAGRSDHPGRAVCRLGRARRADHGNPARRGSRPGWPGVAPIWRKAVRSLRIGHVDIFARPIGTR